MGKLIIDGVEFKFQKIYNSSGETDELVHSIFSYNKLLTYAEMEMVKIINHSGFKDSNIETAILKNARVLGSGVFNYCSKLTKIDIPNVISLGNRCFASCVSLETIILNDEIIEIEERTFANCRNLKSIKLPSKLEKVGKHAFYMSPKLSILSLPDTLEKIEEFAFAETPIAITQLPKKINIIPSGAFDRCYSLTNLILGGKGYPIEYISPNNTSEYPYTTGSFNYCNGLKKITVYTTGGQPLAGAPWGATNAAITYLPA